MAPQNTMEEESNFGAQFEQEEVEMNITAGGFDNRAFEKEAEDGRRTKEDKTSVEIVVKSDMSTDVMDFDDILPHIGEFGRYQKMLFLMMIPFAFFVAFVYFTQIFITLVPDEHWCNVPELMNLTKEQR